MPGTASSGYHGHPGRPGQVGGSVSTGTKDAYSPTKRHELYVRQKSEGNIRVAQKAKDLDMEEKKGQGKERDEYELNQLIEKDIELDKREEADDISNIEEDSKERLAYIEELKKIRQMRIERMQRVGKTKEEAEKHRQIKEIDEAIRQVERRERRARDKQKELKDKETPIS